MAEKKNALVPDRKPEPMSGPLNTLAAMVGYPGSNYEAMKGYVHQFGFDPTDYTEKHLSPEGREAVRKLAALNYGDPNTGMYTNHPVKSGEPGALSLMLGKVAPGNIRKVNIDGVPYWQVLDQYDFNDAKTRAANGGKVNMVKGFATGGKEFYNPERAIPAMLDLQYNSNFLVPVSPDREAHPDSVEAFRQKNRLPYPNKTLGSQALNALMPHNSEKVMP